MNKAFLRFAAVAGMLGVVAGAMLSHQLRTLMPEDARQIYETAIRYQFYHVFALVATVLLSAHISSGFLAYAGKCFMAGILLFSGSLYLISALITKGIAVPVLLGILTPIGGLAFISGWIFLILAAGKMPAR